MKELKPEQTCGHALILVPHSDDEILMFAGLIQRLISVGQMPDVALVTNGDYEATTEDEGVIRPRETLQALCFLGLEESHVHLLGYADTGMPKADSFLWGLYQEQNENAIHISHIGSHTYAPPEHPDFHRALFGCAGAYTRGTLMHDLQTLIEQTKPDLIFTTHPQDAHGDHSALYYLVRMAAGNIPVCTAFTHSNGGDAIWPLDGERLTCPPDLGCEWGTRWQLMLTPEEQAKKALALEMHKTAMKPDAVVFLRRFCKEDEAYFPPKEDTV